MFQRIRRAMRELVAGGPFAFTFQTQSLFDASVPGVPHFVYTDHTELAATYYPDHDPRDLPSKRWLARERQIYANAALVFTMSSHVRRSVIEHYGIDPDRVRCVFAGSNVETTAAPPAAEDPHASKRVLFIGRDWTRKGGPQLLEAFRIARRQHPDATLVIAGSTPEVAEPGVEVLGEISAEEASAQYRRATVFALPTRLEPFGIVFVEALKHGVPVVATRLGAVPDIVQDGETGLLVEPGDVDGLAAALAALLGDPERCRRFGELGRRRMEERYTWAHTVDAMTAQIRATIAARAAHGAAA